MLQYTCSVKLNGSLQHVVTNKLVTIPEIGILRKLHGLDAVGDLRSAPAVDRSDTDERERLVNIYDRAHDEADGLVGALYGPHAPLPNRLSAIGMDPKAEAARMRETAQAQLAAADSLDGNEEDESVDELFDEEIAA